MATEEVGIRLSLSQRREVARGLEQTADELEGVADKNERVESSAARATKKMLALGGRAVRRGISGLARGTGSLISSVGSGLYRAGVLGAKGIGLITVAAGIAGAKAVGLAGDARETGSAFNTVFGKNAPRLQRHLDELGKTFGLYVPDLQDATRQFGVFGKAAGVADKQLPGFSSSLVDAGLDLSSFYNTDPGDTFEAIQSGLSGEAEPLRQFGIFLSDAAIKAEAAKVGLGDVADSLTDQQKVMLRQRIILRSLGDAQGDLERTSKGFANQQRNAGGQLKTFLKLAGGPLTTAATGFFRGLNKVGKVAINQLTKRLPGLEKNARHLSETFRTGGAYLAHKLPGFINKTGRRLEWAKGKVSDLRDWWAKTFNAQAGDQASELGDNLGLLATNLGDLSTELPGVTDAMSVANEVTGFLADHTDLLGKAMPFLVAGFLAYKTAQLAANVAALVSVPVKIADIVATRQLTKANVQLAAAQTSTVPTTVAATGATALNTGAESTNLLTRGRNVIALGLQKGAMVASAAATKIVTGAQWLLNRAMAMNPIGMLVIAAGLLVIGFVLLWRKSETFRKALITLAIWGIKAFRFLLKAAFAAFDGILAAAEKGLGWIPGLGGKIKSARKSFDAFGDAVVHKLDGVVDKLEEAKKGADALATDRSAVITLTTVRINKYETAGQSGPAPTGSGGSGGKGGGGGKGHPRSTSRTVLPSGGALTDPPAVDIPKRLARRGPRDNRPAGSGRGQVVQLVVSRKVLAEAVLDGVDDKGARR